ncbi:hypothetical protein GGR53DRAFT_467422 [Hypoxylon sp. FL1150]|nr:hypothetical protein GGR53DRAFT_467422 [Hypoxylon sp. FL1150]
MFSWKGEASVAAPSPGVGSLLMDSQIMWKLQVNVLKPLRHRRSAQLKESEGPDPRHQTKADDGDSLIIDSYEDSGWTPLHMVIRKDSEAAVRLLLDAGACLNSKAQKCPFARELVAPGIEPVR